jgi:hypothetical protein
VFHETAPAFTLVFCIEAAVFLIAAILAVGLRSNQPERLDARNQDAEGLGFEGAHR